MLSLLLDANISWRIATPLANVFGFCIHVEHTDLPIPASDTLIWEYATRKNLIIITNDEDFLTLASIKGSPPKIILLKTGNQSNSFFQDTLIRHKEQIINFSVSHDYSVLEIY